MSSIFINWEDIMKLKERRVMSYFIEATIEIIEKEGIDKVTIRKIADKSGYNSATLYNYFKNLDVLLMYASVKYLEGYIKDLKKKIVKVDNPIDRYIKIYEVFNDFCFKYPDIYFNMFYGTYKNMLHEVINEYYVIFPEELEGIDEDIMLMLTSGNIFERDKAITKSFLKCGYHKEDIDFIIETTIRVHSSYLYEAMINKDTSNKKTKEEFIKYLKNLIYRVGDRNE